MRHLAEHAVAQLEDAPLAERQQLERRAHGLHRLGRLDGVGRQLDLLLGHEVAQLGVALRPDGRGERDRAARDRAQILDLRHRRAHLQRELLGGGWSVVDERRAPRS